tara:strand:+ start:1486 stop:2127 length:642 start_codon:yes stop_codon:yes gene_type:complete
MSNNDFPNEIPVFPLSNFIIFPETTVPLNIFEPRYLQMIDDSMKSHRLIGMIQPKKQINDTKPDLFNVGCVGKITSFNETEDGRYIIIINGISRFKVLKEMESEKLYRICKVNFDEFRQDLKSEEPKPEFNDLNFIFKNFRSLFKRQGYSINLQDLKNQSFDKTINSLAMASPFSLEEKQILLETPSLNTRKVKLEEILKTYILDKFSNTTIQ